jgi:hypothetical protein
MEYPAEEIKYCQHPQCRHTNWGGRGRRHEVQPDCYEVELLRQKLKLEKNFEFQDAYFSLPHLDKLGGIQYHDDTGKVSMSLESFKTLAGFFENASYALRKPDGGIYELTGMTYKAARDLAEIGGAQLLQKFETGWFDA